MEIRGELETLIQTCVHQNLRVRKTKHAISQFLNTNGISHNWEERSVSFDTITYKINFNTNGFCRGYVSSDSHIENEEQ